MMLCQRPSPRFAPSTVFAAITRCGLPMHSSTSKGVTAWRRMWPTLAASQSKPRTVSNTMPVYTTIVYTANSRVNGLPRGLATLIENDFPATLLLRLRFHYHKEMSHAVALLLLATSLFAQSLGNAGRVEGRLTDPSGAAVVGAQVEIVNPLTNYP